VVRIKKSYASFFNVWGSNCSENKVLSILVDAQDIGEEGEDEVSGGGRIAPRKGGSGPKVLIKWRTQPMTKTLTLLSKVGRTK